MPKPTNTTDNTNTNDAAAELARLREENARLKAAQAAGGRISFKVSEKGGLSVYGLGRWPVTLYRSQWERLLSPETVKGIQSYMAANAGSLATKE